MKKRCDIPSRSSYMRRLRTFLEERHPTLRYAEDMIRTRSEKARFTFLHKLDEGYSPVSARKAADAVLFEGLIFSKFDTVRCILATEFPVIPPHWQRSFTFELLPVCETVFARYDLSDRIVEESAYNHLIAELIEQIRCYIDDNRPNFK